MELVNSGVVSIKVQEILWIMQTNLISIAENWINKKKEDTLWSFLFCRLVTLSRNLVSLSKSNLKCLSVSFSMY